MTNATHTGFQTAIKRRHLREIPDAEREISHIVKKPVNLSCDKKVSMQYLFKVMISTLCFRLGDCKFLS
jgi:hypothetical protein